MDVANVLAKASDNLSVRRAFGSAYEKDGLLIIPVAMVAGGGGGGTGHPRPQGDSGDQDPGRVDAGAGFGGLVLPIGAYVVKGDQVRWVPAVDTTVVVLAALGLARMLIRNRTRPRRQHGRS